MGQKESIASVIIASSYAMRISAVQEEAIAENARADFLKIVESSTKGHIPGVITLILGLLEEYVDK